MIRRLGQTAAVLKVRVGHAKPCRSLVHHFHKFLFCPGYVFRHGYGSVVTGSHHDAFDHGLYRLGLPLFQKDLGTSHGLGVSAGNHLVGHFDFPGIQSVKNQDQCHDFRNTGGTPFRICIFFVYYLSGGCLH